MTMEYHSAYILKKARRQSRLNRQRRAAIMAFIAAAALAGAIYGGLFAPADVYGQSGVYVSVKKGDSLWSIAREHKGNGGDTRAYVHAISEENGLDGNVIYEGQILYIPGGV